MFNKATKTKLKALGFDVEKLIAAAVHAEEQDFDVPEINTFTEDEITARDENAKKAGMAEGKKAGLDIAVKAIAKKLNLEGEFKDPDSLSKAITDSTGKGSDEQVKLLVQRAEKAEQERDSALNETKTAKRDAELLSSFPPNRKGDLTDSEYLQLFKLSHDIVEEDGKTVVKKGGQTLRVEKTQDPLPLKDAINAMFTERKFISDGQQQQGRGGNDQQGGNGGSGIKTYSAAEAKWIADNPDKPNLGHEFHAYIGQLAKEPGFDLNA